MSRSAKDKAKGAVKLLNDKNLNELVKKRKEQLFRSLRKSGVNFNEEANKPELQAVWAMTKIGILDKGDTPDEKFLEVATVWCSMTVLELEEYLEARKLKNASNKWGRVELLIRDEHENPNPAKERNNDESDVHSSESLRDLTLGNAGPSGTQNEDTYNQTYDPEIVNLLMTMMRHEAAAGRLVVLGFASVFNQSLLKTFDKITQFKTSEKITAALSSPGQDTAKLLSWVCSESEMLEAATGSMIVPGFQKGALQFIINPEPSLLNEFQDELKKVAGESRLLFHGTSLFSVRSILTNGFQSQATSSNLTYTAEHPATSILGYAFKAAGDRSGWANSPNNDWGALLGCEVASNRQEGAGIYTFANHRAVMPRYLFLLPPHHRDPATPPPSRASVKPVMIAAFKKIRAMEEED